jgi:hypothetical protein
MHSLLPLFADPDRNRGTGLTLLVASGQSGITFLTRQAVSIKADPDSQQRSDGVRTVLGHASNTRSPQ